MLRKCKVEDYLNIVKEVEDEIRYPFDDEEIRKVFDFTIRKCELNHKDSDYVPLLFRDSLKEHALDEWYAYQYAIRKAGGIANV